MDCLEARNGHSLPWDAHSTRSTQIEEKLGIFCGPVLGLLRRDPANRMRITAFTAACHQLLRPAVMDSSSTALSCGTDDSASASVSVASGSVRFQNLSKNTL